MCENLPFFFAIFGSNYTAVVNFVIVNLSLVEE